MSWTTTSIELDDNQTQIRDSNVNELIVQGGLPSINWSQLGTIII